MHAFCIGYLLILFGFEVGMNGPASSCRFDDPLKRKGERGKQPSNKDKILGG